jgi:hypothetical protein
MAYISRILISVFYLPIINCCEKAIFGSNLIAIEIKKINDPISFPKRYNNILVKPLEVIPSKLIKVT